jgi:hypothetical protein
VNYLDVPKYRIRPRPERFLVDKVLILIGLGILLYLGIYVNYYLLDTVIPVYLNWLFIIGVVLLIILELIVCYVRYGNYVYEFYEHNIVINERVAHNVNYSDIDSVNYSTNFLDHWIKTGSIVLTLKNGKKVKMRYLDNPNQAYILIQSNMK